MDGKVCGLGCGVDEGCVFRVVGVGAGGVGSLGGVSGDLGGDKSHPRNVVSCLGGIIDEEHLEHVNGLVDVVVCIHGGFDV